MATLSGPGLKQAMTSPPLNSAGISIRKLAAGVRHGDWRAVDVVEGALQRAQQDPLNAWLHVDAEAAMRHAEQTDAVRRVQGTLGPLAGIPIGVKDNIHVLGMPTTCASRMLQGYLPPFQATAMTRLQEAGAVLIGKTNMDEFAMGSSGEFSVASPTRNPWRPERSPGGSSSGSAAAVASGQLLAAIGTDTGGSVRQPAAFCGVVGFKPTWGRISRHGLVAFASSMDQLGPLTRNVADAALLYAIMAGRDPLDATTSAAAVTIPGDDDTSALSGLRVGVVRELLDGVQVDIARACRHIEDLLRDAGARIVPVSLPMATHAVATYQVIAAAEASSNLARFDGVRLGHRCISASSLTELQSRSRAEGFGAEVKRRILLGTWVLSAGYGDGYFSQAQRVRTLLCREFTQAFSQCDVLLTPTTPTTAFSLGERTHDPVHMYLADLFTVSANLAGLPAISLPVGLDHEGLPIGIQLMSAPFAEERLLAAAQSLEARLPQQPEPPHRAAETQRGHSGTRAFA